MLSTEKEVASRNKYEKRTNKNKKRNERKEFPK